MLSADPAFLEWRARPSRDSLRRLLQANQDRVYSLCFQVLHHAQDAEDAAQESLIEMARGVGSLQDPQKFSSWMYRVCLNNALTLRRERRRRKEREERRAAMATAPATDDIRDAVHDALAALEDDERALVVEHYFEKATLEELGARRGVSGVAVWKRIEHAKERMKRALAGVAVTQLNSVLEAAEFVPAPSGFSVEGALASAARGSMLPRILVGAAVLAVAVLTAIVVIPKSTDSAAAAPPQVSNSVSTPPAPAPVAEKPPPPPVQDETTRVVDPEGHPIQGALVFAGRWYRLRGDDAFDLFRPHSIKDGVATDAEGRFQLETKAPFISAWHDEYTPTTVKATEKVIRMKARGTLKGRLVDAAGKGRAGIEVTLDKRGPKATTDAEGAFTFEKVIAGYRGLILPNYRLGIAVRIDPGETLNVDIGPGVDVALDVSAHPKGPGIDVNAGIIGVGRTSSLVPCMGKTPTLTMKGVLPGRYLYGEWHGPRGWVEVTDKGGTVTFGASTLVVEAEASTTFYVLPAEANEIIEVAVMKMGLQKAGPGSPLKMEYLTEGDYEIRNPEGVTLKNIKVGVGETRITLKNP